MAKTGQPQFGGLHFWVRDLNATLAFYRAIGLEPGEPNNDDFLSFDVHDGMSFAFGTYGLTRQYDPAFEPPMDGAKGAAALQFTLATRAAVDELYERLTSAGYASHLAPIDAFWRARYCEVADPDGNVVGFHGRD